MLISPKFISLRPYIQAAVLIIICLLPVAYFYGYTAIRGNFYAWHVFGIPFADPLNAIQSCIQGLMHGFWPNTTLILGALFSLLLAFLCGRIFCSWLCPYGFLSELIWKNHSTQSKIKTNSWKWRIILATFGIILGAVIGIPLLNQLSGPGIISLAPQEFWRVVLLSLGIVHSGPQGEVIIPPAVVSTSTPLFDLFIMMSFMLSPVAIILISEYFLKKRIWCAYMCPQALLLMLATRLGRICKIFVPTCQINWQATYCTCKGKNPCVATCSLNLNPRTLHKNTLERDACINCGDCVKICAKVNEQNSNAALSLMLNKNKV